MVTQSIFSSWQKLPVTSPLLLSITSTSVHRTLHHRHVFLLSTCLATWELSNACWRSQQTYIDVIHTTVLPETKEEADVTIRLTRSRSRSRPANGAPSRDNAFMRQMIRRFHRLPGSALEGLTENGKPFRFSQLGGKNITGKRQPEICGLLEVSPSLAWEDEDRASRRMRCCEDRRMRQLGEGTECVCRGLGGVLPPTLDREHVTDQLSDVMCVRADVC